MARANNLNNRCPYCKLFTLKKSFFKNCVLEIDKIGADVTNGFRCFDANEIRHCSYCKAEFRD